MDSPMTSSSTELLPSSSPRSFARLIISPNSGRAGPFLKSLPTASLIWTWGTRGAKYVPPLTTRTGKPASSLAALVIMAGVGCPSGVTGMASIIRGFSWKRYSASAGGVSLVSSGVAPATLIPGIVLISVFPKTRRKRLFILTTAGVFIQGFICPSFNPSRWEDGRGADGARNIFRCR